MFIRFSYPDKNLSITSKKNSNTLFYLQDKIH